MIARVAAGLATGLISLYASAAIACTGPACGAYAPASPSIAFAPPAPGLAFRATPSDGPPGADLSPPPPPPPPPPTYTDDMPWRPAYASESYGPSFYEDSAGRDRFGRPGTEMPARQGFEDRRNQRGAFGSFAGSADCNLCGPAPQPLSPAIPCSDGCEAHFEVAPRISESFFFGGMSGGAGPGLEIAGPAGGGFFAFGGASAFGSARSFAYASATARASASARSHGKPGHGCGCGHKGK